LTYRDDDAAARAELAEIEAELERLRSEHDQLSQRILKWRADEARIARMKHPAWGAPGVVLTIGILVSLAMRFMIVPSQDPTPNQIDPEVERLREELSKAQAEKRGLAESIRVASLDGGRDPGVLAVLTAMRSLDARDEDEARQIVTGAGCIRGDRSLYERAGKRARDAGETTLEQACRALEDATR
jgi:hypothetical protein